MIYLSEKSGGKLIPRDPAGRYTCLQWMMFQMGGTGPMFGQYHHFANYAVQECDCLIRVAVRQKDHSIHTLIKRVGRRDGDCLFQKGPRFLTFVHGQIHNRQQKVGAVKLGILADGVAEESSSLLVLLEHIVAETEAVGNFGGVRVELGCRFQHGDGPIRMAGLLIQTGLEKQECRALGRRQTVARNLQRRVQSVEKQSGLSLGAGQLQQDCRLGSHRRGFFEMLYCCSRVAAGYQRRTEIELGI